MSDLQRLVFPKTQIRFSHGKTCVKQNARHRLYRVRLENGERAVVVRSLQARAHLHATHLSAVRREISDQDRTGKSPENEEARRRRGIHDRSGTDAIIKRPDLYTLRKISAGNRDEHLQRRGDVSRLRHLDLIDDGRRIREEIHRAASVSLREMQHALHTQR